jgi:short-subunit dehydrogenase
MQFKTVVITGGSAGIGRATARLFAQSGAKLALLARGEERLQDAKKELVQRGAEKVLTFAVDVSNWEKVFQAAQEVEKKLGPIDLWINGVSNSVIAPVKSMTAEEYHRVTEVTYFGFVHGTLAALKLMLPRNKGIILQVSSGLAYRSIPLQSAYCAAKHAIKGFTESLITELKHDKSEIKVKMIHLPAVNTPQFTWTKNKMARRFRPMPPVFQPEVAARAIVWAARHRRREVFLGAFNALAIKFNKIAPSVVDWYLAKKGYEGQLLHEPKGINAPENLWRPVPGLYKAHGEFNTRAHDTSSQFWLTTHRAVIALGAALFGTSVYLSRRGMNYV